MKQITIDKLQWNDLFCINTPQMKKRESFVVLNNNYDKKREIFCMNHQTGEYKHINCNKIQYVLLLKTAEERKKERMK